MALPWEPELIANLAISYVGWIAIVAAVALALGWSNLRSARVAFRPSTESADGKGELQVQTMEPRVGRAFEGAIKLLREPTPGQEYNVRLTCWKPGATAAAFQVEHKARARQGAHGVNLPFRFEVPASAPPSGRGHRWRLDFAPAEKKLFGRSSIDVKLAPAPDAEIRAASVPRAEAHAPTGGGAAVLASPEHAAAHGYVEHIEKLYNTLGGKLTPEQREQLRTKLSGPQVDAFKQQLEAVRKISPQHIKLIKYALIGFIALFFVLPFVLSTLGIILAAIFGQ